MAKKKKPTLKPPAGVNRGFATTSVPKKVVESKPDKEPARPSSSASGQHQNHKDNKDSSALPSDRASAGKSGPDVSTLYGFDEDDAEQQLLQDLVDKYWDKADKEVSKLWKAIEFDRRHASTFQRFDLDPEERERLLDLISYSYRVPETEDKPVSEDQAQASADSVQNPTSGQFLGQPGPLPSATNQDTATNDGRVASTLSAHAVEFVPGTTGAQPSAAQEEKNEDSPQPLHPPPPDWDSLAAPPLKEATQPLDKILPKALVIRGLLLKLGFSVEQADLALKHTLRMELEDCLTYLALRLSEEELERASKQVGGGNNLSALPTSNSSTPPPAESSNPSQTVSGHSANSPGNNAVGVNGPSTGEEDDAALDRSVPPSHPAYTFKRTVMSARELRYVQPPAPGPTPAEDPTRTSSLHNSVETPSDAKEDKKKKRVIQPPSNEMIILPLFRVRELLKYAVSMANEAQAGLTDEEGEMDVVTAGATKAWVASKIWTNKLADVYSWLKRAIGQPHLLNPQGMGYETSQVVRRVHESLYRRTAEAEKVPRFNAAAAESVLNAAVAQQSANDRPRAGKENWAQILASAEEEVAQKRKAEQEEAAQKREKEAQETDTPVSAVETGSAKNDNENSAAQATGSDTTPSKESSEGEDLVGERAEPQASVTHGEQTSELSRPAGEEEESGLGGLFEEPRTGESPDLKNAGSSNPEDSNIKVRQLPAQAKGGGGGNSPQSLLLQTLHRLDPKATAKYQTLSGPGRFFRSRLQVQWTGPHVAAVQAALPVSQRRPPDQVYIDTFILTGECTETKSQAHDLVATIALNCIEHDRPAQRMLSAGYREWWDEIENARLRERSTAARMALAHVRDIVQPRLVDPPQVPALTPVAAASTRAKTTSEDDTSLSAPLESRRPNERTIQRLHEALERRQASAPYAAMLVGRQQLPIYAFRDRLLDVLDHNQVFVLSGETGCGKSTQVPAYILEHCLGKGDPCKIYCTEPRRISAISLAERVSAELGENKGAVGTAESLVGYAIRLESSVGRDARLIYATNGIVLRMLEGDGFKDLTHIIIDEVHERSIESDFLLIILKSLMAAKPELKVVLMSATVDAERISAYFGGCPTLSVPGRTFPVQVEHLEDAVELCKYVVEPNSPYERRQKRRNGGSAVAQQSNLANLKSIEDEEEEENDEAAEEDAAELAAVNGGKAYSRQTIETIDKMDHNVVNHELIFKLLEKVCFDAPEYEKYSKAILVFMPGLADIRSLHDMLTAHPRFNQQGFRIYPLHSSLSSESQQQVFEVPPAGIRKIVISTNIAETGVTIPDVTCVIDSGRHREVRFDEKRQISRLVDCYIAQSNAKQRRGRAGRVQEGLCFHMFTKMRYQHHMEEHPIPEMLRLSLQDLALKLKVMKIKIGNSIEHALSQALDPPTPVNIQRAVAALVEVKALTTTEEITPLGRHLSKLPLDVHMGKFLLVASTMRCLDAALTITAGLNVKSPFVAPFGKEARADAAKQGFNLADSDFLTLANAFNSWKRAVGNHYGRQFCQKNYLSHQILSEMEELRQQYLLYLIDAGFVQVSSSARKDISRLRIRGWGKTRFTPVPEEYSVYSSSASVVHAAAAAGLYPKIITIEPKSPIPGSGNANAGFTLRTIGNNQPIAIHPGSVNFRRKLVDLPATVHQMLYCTLLRSKRLYACETAPLDDRMLLLMCGESEGKLPSLTLSLDKNKVRYHVTDLRSLVLLVGLREQLQRLIRSSFRSPGQAWMPRQEWFFDMAIRFLGTDSPADAQGRLRPA